MAQQLDGEQRLAPNRAGLFAFPRPMRSLYNSLRCALCDRSCTHITHHADLSRAPGISDPVPSLSREERDGEGRGESEARAETVSGREDPSPELRGPKGPGAEAKAEHRGEPLASKGANR